MPADANEYGDALELITEHHEEIQDICREFGDLSEAGDKRAALRRLNAALQVHSHLEEELFYPALHDLLSETALVDEAEVEHDLIDTLLSELTELDPHDALFDSRVDVLIDTIKHHFAEEETGIFTQIRADKPDLELLGQEMRERKEELEAEYAPDPDDDDEEDESGDRDDEQSFDE